MTEEAPVQLIDVSFSFGGRLIFSEVNAAISPGSRIALIGPNGSGKTTLLSIIEGKLEADTGDVVLPSAAVTGILHQEELADEDTSIRDALLKPFRELVELRDKIHHAQRAMADGDEDAAVKLGEMQTEYEMRGGYTLEERLNILASELNLGRDALEREVSSLSGGEKRRVALVRALAAEPDLLLLDEPTNHLDIQSIMNLEKLLSTFRGTVIAATHDRAFIDAFATGIMEVDAEKVRYLKGGYGKFLKTKSEEIQRKQKRNEQERKEIARQEELIRRTHFGMKSRQAKSRKKAVERIERTEVEKDGFEAAYGLNLRFPTAPRSPKRVLETKGLGVSFGQRQLFTGFDFTLYRGEKVGVIGPNGSGKSSFLKALTASIENVRGEVKMGRNVEFTFADQHLESLDDTLTPLEELRRTRSDMSDEYLRTHLGAFRIHADDAKRTTGSFSGGERTRIALAKLILVPRNLLILDEPTNHLDIPSREILENALKDFEGSVIIVSHDRYLLDMVADRILVINRGSIEAHQGGWSDFVERKGRRAIFSSEKLPAHASVDSKDQKRKEALKEKRKAHYLKRKARSRREEKLRKDFASVEKEILELEELMEEVSKEIYETDQIAWERLEDLAGEKDRIRTRLAGKMARWEKIAEEIAGLDGYNNEKK